MPHSSPDRKPAMHVCNGAEDIILTQLYYQLASASRIWTWGGSVADMCTTVRRPRALSRPNRLGILL